MLQASDTNRLAEPRLQPLPLRSTDVRNPTAAYGVALAAVACVVVVRVLLQHTLGDQFLLLPLVAAIACAAYYGGHGPALTALVVGAAAITVVIPHARHAFAAGDPAYQLGLVLYGLVGYGCILAIDSLRSERDAARRLCAEKERSALERDPEERDEMLSSFQATALQKAAPAFEQRDFLHDPLQRATGGQNCEAEDRASNELVSWLVRARRMLHSVAAGPLRRRRGERRRKQLRRHRHRG